MLATHGIGLGAALLFLGQCFFRKQGHLKQRKVGLGIAVRLQGRSLLFSPLRFLFIVTALVAPNPDFYCAVLAPPFCNGPISDLRPPKNYL